MHLAIDVGNTQAVFGLWDGADWVAVWRRRTDPATTEDEIASWLQGLFALAGLSFAVERISYASVVPGLDEAIRLLGDKWFGRTVRQLKPDSDHGLTIHYNPPGAVGADRIANALGALARFPAPLVVVDFGTATTFDAIDRNGVYLGGSILPGPMVSAQALVAKTAKLPQVPLVAPPSAIGTTTVHALQSGAVLGYAFAIEGLANAISEELGGGATIIATGGLGQLYLDLCPSLQSYEPNLTLEGLLVADQRQG